MQLEESEHLARGGVNASLWHHAQSSLRIPGDELAEVVHPRGLVHHLVISNVAIALKQEIQISETIPYSGVYDGSKTESIEYVYMLCVYTFTSLEASAYRRIDREIVNSCVPSGSYPP